MRIRAAVANQEKYFSLYGSSSMVCVL
jgi:hypothetical protein